MFRGRLLMGLHEPAPLFDRTHRHDHGGLGRAPGTCLCLTVTSSPRASRDAAGHREGAGRGRRHPGRNAPQRFGARPAGSSAASGGRGRVRRRWRHRQPRRPADGGSHSRLGAPTGAKDPRRREPRGGARQVALKKNRRGARLLRTGRRTVPDEPRRALRCFPRRSA